MRPGVCPSESAGKINTRISVTDKSNDVSRYHSDLRARYIRTSSHITSVLQGDEGSHSVHIVLRAAQT